MSTRPSLATEDVVAAAFDVLDGSGFDGFTAQAVTDRLGASGPIPDGHPGDRRQLLDLLAADMWVRIHDEVDAATDGRSWHRDLATFARALRRTVLQHRDGARVLASATTGGAAPPQPWRVMTRLVDEGVDWETVTRAYSVVYHVTVGFCIEEQAAGRPALHGDGGAWPPARPMWDAIVTHPYALQPERIAPPDRDAAFDKILDQVLRVVTAPVRG